MFDFTTLPGREGTGALKWDRRSAQEKARGLLPLSVADMEFFCAPCVRQAVEKAASHGLYGYTDPERRYFAAVTGWMHSRHGWEVSPEQIVCTCGVIPAVSVAIRAFTQPGDRVIVQTPGYGPLRRAVLDNGRELVESPLLLREGRYEMDFDQIRRQAAHPRAKLLLLCSPHNPVGRVWSREELGQLAGICLEQGLLMVSDEIHFDILPGERPHTVLGSLCEAVAQASVVCTSASKAFNLAGLQLANIVIANERMRERFRQRLAADGYSNIPYFGFAATIAAYEEGGPWLDELCALLRGNAQRLEAYLAAHFPQVRLSPLEGTYLAWTDWRALGLRPQALEQFMRGQAGLILDEGPLFGREGEGFERFNIAVPPAELDKALDRLLEAGRRRGFAL